MDKQQITKRIIQIISEFPSLDEDVKVTESSKLLGEGAILDSAAFLELMLELEEFSEDEFDKEFDWENDSIFSETKSLFTTPEALADYLFNQVTD